MKKLCGFVGATAASYLGWWLGGLFGGIMTQYMVSTVAGGFGLYYGIKFAKERWG